MYACDISMYVMYVCMYVSMYVMYICTCVYMYVCIYNVCMHVYMHIMYVYDVCIYVMHACDVGMYMMYVWMYVMYVWINKWMWVCMLMHNGCVRETESGKGESEKESRKERWAYTTIDKQKCGERDKVDTPVVFSFFSSLPSSPTQSQASINERKARYTRNNKQNTVCNRRHNSIRARGSRASHRTISKY
jgi:hypothetical protein